MRFQDAFNGEKLINIALSGDLRQLTEHITKNQVKINYQNSVSILPLKIIFALNLFDSHFNFSQRGETALHTALRMGRFNIIRPLLEKGAKIDIPDYVSFNTLFIYTHSIIVHCVFAVAEWVDATSQCC